MRRYLWLLLFVFLTACPKSSQPPPPPTEVCGNGTCGSGETQLNCPQDCGTPAPVCDKDSKCEPERGETTDNCADCKTVPPVCGDGTCSQGETKQNCPADCQPDPEPEPKQCWDGPALPQDDRRFERHIILGNYVGVMGQEDHDWCSYFKMFEKGNGTSVHLTSPWANQKHFYPWYFDGQKFHFDKWNEKWWTKFEEMLKAADYYDIELELTPIDQYCDLDKWGDRPEYTSKKHPFSRICGKDGRQFYYNWNRRDASDPKNFSLFTWKVDSEFDVSTYRATSPEGKGLMAYLERFAATCAKYKNVRFLFRLANEPFFVVSGPQERGQIDYEKSRYLDDRSNIYFHEVLKKHGLKPGPKVRYIIEEPWYRDGRVYDMYWLDKTYRQYIAKKDFLYEFHGVCSVEDYKFLTDKLKIAQRHLLGSSDGCKEDQNYYKNMKAIERLKPMYFDYKLLGSYPEKWDDSDQNKNNRIFVPRMEKEIWQ